MILQVKESEAKTGEVELETREAELRDRQVAMLIKLDEQGRYYTLCGLLRHNSLQKGCLQSLRTPGEAGWDVQQLPELDDEIPRSSVSDSPGNIKRCYCFCSKKAANNGFDPPKRTAFFGSSASVVVEYEFFTIPLRPTKSMRCTGAPSSR